MRAASFPTAKSDSLPLSLRTSPKRCRRSSTMFDLLGLAIARRFYTTDGLMTASERIAGPQFWRAATIVTCFVNVITLPGLFAADEADAEGEGAALAAGEGAEVGGVDVVDDGVGILAVEGVDGFYADAPEVAAEAELFFESEIEAGVGGEAGGVGGAD